VFVGGCGCVVWLDFVCRGFLCFLGVVLFLGWVFFFVGCAVFAFLV